MLPGINGFKREILCKIKKAFHAKMLRARAGGILRLCPEIFYERERKETRSCYLETKSAHEKDIFSHSDPDD